ncbi:MAG: LicD family protein [Lachnospiraceae bacterium]|nr:LicD family protein [Lachnospiraceae bacterium]
MIPFEREFFLGEERDGFFVKPMMKCMWAAEMEVLSEINRICINHDLHWFAGWGTLLGAARHKGFIPWDDDLDICMLRSDYNKFIHFAQSELPADFLLLSPYTDNDWNQPHCTVKNSHQINYSPEHLAAFHACPYIIGVDIFPLDALPPDPEGTALSTLASVFLHNSWEADTNLEEVLEALPELEEVCHTKFDPSHNLANQLLRAADKVCQCFDISECDDITHYLIHALQKIPFKKEWFAETIQLPFENIMVYAPKEYDKVLTVLYGDWRTPKKYEYHTNFKDQADQLKAELTNRIMRGESIFEL